MTSRTSREVQIGDQAAWATAAAPTIYLAGVESVSMPNSLVTERQQLLRGIMGPGKNIVAPRFEARGITVVGQFIYQQAMYYLDGLAEATPAGAAPTVYGYVGPTTTVVAPRWQTLVCGADNAIYGLTGAVLEGYSLSWQWGEIVQQTTTWMGYAVQDDTLAALTEPTDAVTLEATGCHVSAYIDAWAGTMGNTSVGTMLSGSLDITPNREFTRYTGTCYPSGTYDKNGWDITGKLSFTQDATTAAFMDAMVGAITRKYIRIRFTNGGAGATLYRCDFDIRAEITIDELYTDNDDLVTADISFRSIQDEANSDVYLAINLSNQTAAAY